MLSDFIESLEDYLTDPDKVKLLYGIKQINSFISDHGSKLSDTEICFILKFYAGKFNIIDSLFIEELVNGMMNALTLNSNSSLSIVADLVESIFNQLNVQSLPKDTRYQVLKLLHYFICNNAYLDKLILLDDFTNKFLQNVQRESSPKHLLLIFEMYCSVIQTLRDERFMEEIFESIAIYFPIDYDASTSTVKREELSQRILLCLYCLRIKAGNLLVPFLIEKCMSDFGQAKVDSFEALTICISGNLPDSLIHLYPDICKPFANNKYPLKKEIFFAQKFSIFDSIKSCSNEDNLSGQIIDACLCALQDYNLNEHESLDVMATLFKAIWPLKEKENAYQINYCVRGLFTMNLDLLNGPMTKQYILEMAKRMKSFMGDLLKSLENYTSNDCYLFLTTHDTNLSMISLYLRNVQSRTLIDKELFLNAISLSKEKPTILNLLVRIYSELANTLTEYAKSQSFQMSFTIESALIDVAIAEMSLSTSTTELEVWTNLSRLFLSERFTKVKSLSDNFVKTLSDLACLSFPNMTTILSALSQVDDVRLEELIVNFLTKSMKRVSQQEFSQCCPLLSRFDEKVLASFLNYFIKETVLVVGRDPDHFLANGNSIINSLCSNDEFIERILQIAEKNNSQTLIESVFHLSALSRSKILPHSYNAVIKLGFIYSCEVNERPLKMDQVPERIYNLAYSTYFENCSDPLTRPLITDLDYICLFIYSLNNHVAPGVFETLATKVIVRPTDSNEVVEAKVKILSQFHDLFFPPLPRKVIKLTDSPFYYQKLYALLLGPIEQIENVHLNQLALELYLDFGAKIVKRSPIKSLNMIKLPVTVLKLKSVPETCTENAIHLVKIIIENPDNKVSLEDLDVDDILRRAIEKLKDIREPNLTKEILSLLTLLLKSNERVFLRYRAEIVNAIDPLLASKMKLIRLKTALLKNLIFTTY